MAAANLRAILDRKPVDFRSGVARQRHAAQGSGKQQGREERIHQVAAHRDYLSYFGGEATGLAYFNYPVLHFSHDGTIGYAAFIGSLFAGIANKAVFFLVCCAINTFRINARCCASKRAVSNRNLRSL